MQDSCNNFGGEFYNSSGSGATMPVGSVSTPEDKPEKKWWEKATDWVNSDKVKNATDTINKTVNTIKPYLGKDGKTIVNPKSGDGSDKKDDKGNQEVLILGMSPVTFGIVSVAVLLVGSIVAYKIIKK
jgi:hypothetical protein